MHVYVSRRTLRGLRETRLDSLDASRSCVQLFASHVHINLMLRPDGNAFSNKQNTHAGGLDGGRPHANEVRRPSAGERIHT